MHPYFSHDAKGTPIILLEKNQLEEWRASQSEFVQQWLSTNKGSKTSYTLIPSESGSLSCVLFEVDPAGDFFIAGDLPKQLPGGNYALDTSNLTIDSDTLRELSRQFAISWGLAAYEFKRYKKTEEAAATSLFVAEDDEQETITAFVSAIKLTRDLINTPASDMMPEHMSEIVAALAQEFGAEFNETVGDDLLEKNFPMIHAVGRASAHAPRLLDLKWGNPDAPKVTLVGKGVCFDSGGLNLKTGNFMRLMKKDMGGAAHVLGLARLIMATKLPVCLRVLVPAVENAVSGDAFRPGDVIATRKGLSVEIDNTDAEGRLVLCDALAQAGEDKPEMVIDFATLTGACRVALGTELPGFFCNKNEVASKLTTAGLKVKDPVWQLPLHKPYQAMLKSSVADTLNSSPTGLGGAITAALYLQLFVDDETPWIHFDVMAWNDRTQPGRSIGGEAFGLRATYELLKQQFAN